MADYCDRCTKPTPATKVVVCWVGCPHNQCAGHAKQTARERVEEAAYDAAVGSVAPGACGNSPASGRGPVSPVADPVVLFEVWGEEGTA